MKIIFFINQNQELDWRSHTVLNLGLDVPYSSIYYLSRELAKRGHDVTIFSFIKRAKDDLSNKLKPQEDIYDGVQFRDIASLAKDPSLGECDVYVSCESGYSSKFFKAKKSINWVHRNVDGAIKLDSFDHHVLLSEAHVKMFGLEVDDVNVIPNGVADHFFEDYKVRRDPKGISFVGHPIKGMAYIPELMKKLRSEKVDFKMHVYGNALIWGWEQDQFLSLQTKLIKTKAKYHGRVGHKNMSKFLQQQKVFAYPSTFDEPFGLAVLEAMASGQVPVVSSIGNPKNIIRDAGYVIDGLPTEFGWNTRATEKIKEVLDSQSLYEEKAALAKGIASKYTWQNSADKWEALIQS